MQFASNCDVHTSNFVLINKNKKTINTQLVLSLGQSIELHKINSRKVTEHDQVSYQSANR